MPKDLVDGLVALCGFTCAFLLIVGWSLFILLIEKVLYYSELSKEVRFSNQQKELKPRKVVIVKDETE